ncbi:MAG: citrate synthase [Nitrospiraceae bacterium]|nr:citrate synthase [Nitrospiraceae bacterium]
MDETVRIKNTGLRGVPVADTKISFIDGEQGVLIYRGYRIEDLAEKSTFMETAWLLLNGELPSEDQLRSFTEDVARAREIPAHICESLALLPQDAAPMDVLQAAVPLLAMADNELADETRDANVRKAIRLIAGIPAVVAAWNRIRNRLEPLPPDAGLSHAANFLRQFHGTRPDPEMARDLEVCLVLHADHTFNASTFACREVVSTRAHMYAGVAAGVGALSGSLHGGANARVMKMLMELQSEKNVAGWVRDQLDKGQRIMGIGHAVYKTTDPRAKILREISRRLGEKLGQPQWHRLSAAVEDAALAELARRGKHTLKPNVDFYSASVYHMMGISADFMTPVFAVSRIAGWCAHIIEEKFAEAQERPALYRPESDYVGNYCGKTGCVYQPLQERGKPLSSQ